MEEEIKRVHKINGLTEAERYFKDLAEVYLVHYELHMERELNMMLAKGVIVEMESDLQSYHNKKKADEKSKNQLNRLNILKTAIEKFAPISSANMQFRLTLSKYLHEISELKQKVDDLQIKLTNAEDYIDELKQ